MTETAPQTFAEKRRQQFTALAVANENDRTAHRNAARAALHLDRHEHLGEVIDLDDGVQVVEVTGGPFGTVWQHIHDGKPSDGYPNRYLAILAAVGRVFGAEDAAPYAARLLQVPQDEA